MVDLLFSCDAPILPGLDESLVMCFFFEKEFRHVWIVEVYVTNFGASRSGVKMCKGIPQELYLSDVSRSNYQKSPSLKHVQLLFSHNHAG